MDELKFKDTSSAFEFAVRCLQWKSLEEAPRLAIIKSARLNPKTRHGVFEVLVGGDRPLPGIAMADEPTFELVSEGDLVEVLVKVHKVRTGLLRHAKVVQCLILAIVEPTFSISERKWKLKQWIVNRNNKE